MSWFGKASFKSCEDCHCYWRGCCLLSFQKPIGNLCLLKNIRASDDYLLEARCYVNRFYDLIDDYEEDLIGKEYFEEQIEEYRDGLKFCRPIKIDL